MFIDKWNKWANSDVYVSEYHKMDEINEKQNER